MPVSQAIAASKPTPPPTNSGGQMGMTASQMSSSQPAHEPAGTWSRCARRRRCARRPPATRRSRASRPRPSRLRHTTPPKVLTTSARTPTTRPAPCPTSRGRSAGPTSSSPPTTRRPGRSPVGRQLAVQQPPSSSLLGADRWRIPPGTLRSLDRINEFRSWIYAKVSDHGGIREFIQESPRATCRPHLSTSTTYPGSDYYEIGLKDYTQQFRPTCRRPSCAATTRSTPAARPRARRSTWAR